MLVRVIEINNIVQVRGVTVLLLEAAIVAVVSLQYREILARSRETRPLSLSLETS